VIMLMDVDTLPTEYLVEGCNLIECDPVDYNTTENSSIECSLQTAADKTSSVDYR